MRLSLLGRILAISVTFLLVWMASLDLQLAAQGSSDADVQQMAAALDANGNQKLDDVEIRQAIQIWIGGSTVPGTNLTISDAAILKLIQFWITGQTITAEPSDSFQIDGIYFLDITDEGDVIVEGSSLQTIPAGSLITIIGSGFPADPVVHTYGIETGVLAHNETAMITIAPVFSREAKNVDIVISDKNNNAVKAMKTVTINPLDIESVIDPTKTIVDFLSAFRTALAEDNSAEANDLRLVLGKLENAIPMMSQGESRSIAAVFEASDVVALLSKLSANQQTTALSLNPLAHDDFESGDLQLINADGFLGDLVLNTFDTITNADIITAQGGGDVTLSLLNEPMTVYFSEISSLEPVEGEPQDIACVADDDDTIAQVKVAVQAGSDAHFIDDLGFPVAELTLTSNHDGDNISERFSVRWNSEVTGQARNVVFTCTALDAPAFQGPSAKTETLTLSIKAASTPEPGLPDTAPSIVNVNAPTMIAGDGQNHDVSVQFEDANGDVSELRVQTTEGPDAGNPAQTLSLSNVSGLTMGTTSYSINCTNTGVEPFDVTQQVTLIDAKGLESDPQSYTYTCEAIGASDPEPENTAPVIVDIDAPGAFPGDGQNHDVTVNFADQNGNIVAIRAEFTEGPNAGDPPQTLSLNVAGMTTGAVVLSISCTNTGTEFFNVLQKFTLIDSEGLESEPKGYSYTCEPTGTP